MKHVVTYWDVKSKPMVRYLSLVEQSSCSLMSLKQMTEIRNFCYIIFRELDIISEHITSFYNLNITANS